MTEVMARRNRLIDFRMSGHSHAVRGGGNEEPPTQLGSWVTASAVAGSPKSETKLKIRWSIPGVVGFCLSFMSQWGDDWRRDSHCSTHKFRGIYTLSMTATKENYKLTCLYGGDQNTFTVVIPHTANVDKLRKLIRQKQDIFHNVDPTNLICSKVCQEFHMIINA
jgi:hypothetical protein